MFNKTPKKNLIFLHLPKNGGTTFHSILQRKFKSSLIYSLKIKNKTQLGSDAFIQLTESERKRIKILKGHMMFGLHKYLYGESVYITFLRNPIDRISSFYRYVISQPEHRLNKRIMQEKMSFYDFLNKVHEWDIHNAQIRCISGIDDRENIMLEKAMENIENYFPVVGTVEKYNESLILISQMYNLGVPFYTSKNITSEGKNKNKELNTASLQLIKDLNRGDIILFNEVSNRLQNQIDKFGNENLRVKLKHLNFYNKLYNSSPMNIMKNIVNQNLK